MKPNPIVPRISPCTLGNLIRRSIVALSPLSHPVAATVLAALLGLLCAAIVRDAGLTGLGAALVIGLTAVPILGFLATCIGMLLLLDSFERRWVARLDRVFPRGSLPDHGCTSKSGASEAPTHAGGFEGSPPRAVADHPGIQGDPSSSLLWGSSIEHVGAPVVLPRVILASGVLQVVHSYVSRFLTEFGGANETGGLLVGTYEASGDDGRACFRITGFIEAGPKAEFTPSSVLFDAEHQAEVLSALQLANPRLSILGCVHRHPGSLDVCSNGDAVTDREAVLDSDTKELVFGIITINNASQDPTSVRVGNLKIDFFIMSEATGFAYVKLLPELGELPLSEVSPALFALARARGCAVAADLGVLRRLQGLREVSIQLAGQDEGGAVLIRARDNLARADLVLIARADGSQRLVVTPDGEPTAELRGPWEDPRLGSHVWLSHLFLLVRGRVAAPQNGKVHFRRHHAWWQGDRRRLLLEIQAMQERHGDRARLDRRGDTLYWRTEVHESGRTLPVEIIYPDTYPAFPPEIHSATDLPPSPHRLGLRVLCWTNSFSSSSDWNPGRDTAAICVVAAQRWFAAFLVYRTTGIWPEEANH